MTDATVQLVLTVYSIMWAFNVAAYAVVSAGLYRWRAFVKGTPAERAVNISLKIAAVIATARIIAGLAGIGLYKSWGFSPISAVLMLDIASLFLNTAYIMSHGYFLYRDADAAWDATPEEQVTIRHAVSVFNNLRRTAHE